jgi:uncharacterized membrane protein YbhN (UPF0104 family)/membrane-associated phospholipid phosphatase/tRNA A-37 threonylcarbamoyl transferase component Bud32
VTWLRKTTEPAERRPTDIAALVLATVATILLGLFAETQATVDVNVYSSLNALSGELQGLAKIVFALGSIWAVVAVVVALLLFRYTGVALRAAVAGGLAWGVAVVLNDVLPDHTINGLHVDVRVGSGPVFPSANVAVVTALAAVLVPYAVRPLRRIFPLLIVLVALAACYLGTAYPSDALGGFALGIAAGALVLVAFGSPAGRPTVDEIRNALGDLGYDVDDITYSNERVARASVVDVTLTSGETLRVEAFGRDQRDAQIVSKAWHAAAYHEPGLPVFGSRVQQVEHIGYTLMLADRAGVHASRLVRTGVGGADAAIIVTEPPAGRRLDELEPEQVTDDVLAAIWDEVSQLHAAGMSHGNLDSSRIIVSAGGAIGLDDFSSADATGEPQWQHRDDAAVLVNTALIVGNDRAIAATVKALDKARIASLIPVVQPAALPVQTRHGIKHSSKTLKELRGQLASAAGVEDVPPLKIKRLTLVNIGMLAGILLALAIAIPSLEGIDWSSMQSEFEHATWGWVVLTLFMWPLIPSAWATALMGCVNTDLPFLPTVVTQLSCNFLNLITPNGIGGTALQIDYLRKQGVPVASGGSAMVLSSGVGGALQMALFLIAASITATAVVPDNSPPSASQVLIAIAVIAALVGIVLWIPKVRGKVVPQVKRAAHDIWAVMRTPKKALQLFGGDLAGNLLYPLLLGLCLLAFHQKLDYVQLVVVQVGAGMVGNVAPVPGGIGVQEAALTGGLTAFGIPSNPALAAVIVFRAITFALPALLGFFTLRWERAKGYV